MISVNAMIQEQTELRSVSFTAIVGMNHGHDGIKGDAVPFVTNVTDRHEWLRHCYNLEDGLDIASHSRIRQVQRK